MKLALALVLTSSAALAGPGLQGGGLTGGKTTAAAIDAVTYTDGELSLFVDPTGSDSNPCISLALPCLTIQGALNLVPKVLRNRATITVSAGSYQGAAISGFIVDPGFQKANAGLLIDGALMDVAPTTGPATGTASAGSAGSGSTFGTLTDATQTWTSNDAAMVGAFIVTTGGTGSGQTRVVISNTGTAVTIAGTWATAPNATTTYALRRPSVIVNSCAALVPTPLGATGASTAGFQILNNNTGSIPITIRNVDISATCARSISIQGLAETLARQVIMRGSPIGTRTYGANFSVFDICSISASGVGVSSSFGGGVAMTLTYVAVPLGGALNLSGGPTSGSTLSGSQLACNIGVGTGGVGGSLGGGSVNITGVNCDCASSAASTCLQIVGNPSVASIIGPMAVTNCTNGLEATAGGQIYGTAAGVISGNALAYSVNASHGGTITLPTASATITSGTADMSVDNGAATGAFGTLAASYACLISATGTTSRVCRL